MAKVTYTAPRVTSTTDVGDIGSVANPGPLEELVTQSTNIDSANLREEGLDITVFRPKTVASLEERLEDESAGRYQLGSSGVFIVLEGPNNPLPLGYTFATVALLPGDAVEVRAAINFVSTPSPNPWGLGPPAPVGPPFGPPSEFGFRIAVRHPGSPVAFDPLPETERYVGGAFTPQVAGTSTVPTDNEINGRHASLCTMAMVPSLTRPASATIWQAGDYTFRLEHKATADTFPRQVVFYLIKYPKSQEIF